MRAGVERFARRWWGGELGMAGEALAVLAAPASWLWAGATRLRSRARRSPYRVGGLRVISVGNLAVGGTGKTPLTAWIARTLQVADVRACVLIGDAAADEAALHRAWNPDVAVLSGRDRVMTAERARAEGAQVAVLDDGFQHRALARDLDLVLLSADDPSPGRVLPRAPYREAPAALARADVIVLTRRSAVAERAAGLAAAVGAELSGRVAACVHLAPGVWKRLDGAVAEPPTGDVLAVCGVARPQAFRRTLEGLVGGAVELVVFADHHGYSPTDVARIAERAGGRAVVVTEKDAVKLARLVGPEDPRVSVFVLTDRLVWDWGEDVVRTRVLATVLREESQV